MSEEKRKKILLLSDDIRMSSGIATVSRAIVKNTIHKYDWVQLGASIKHPEEGKIADMNDFVKKEWGVEGAYLRVYSSSGYGNPDIVRELIREEKPDVILHFTDPRFWIWLYEMEREIRQHTPIMFYHIWDDLPYPFYNRNFYESCDWIGCISKQTYNIVQSVWGSERVESWNQPEPWQVSYVPHGIDPKEFYPIDEDHEEYEEYTKFSDDFFKRTVHGKKDDFDFIAFWSNRNIRRKMPGDVILAYKTFCDKLPKEKSDRCLLIMHTQTVDDNGTDLIAVKNEVCPDYKVIFSASGISTEKVNYLVNLADVGINISSNEGFGLTSCEAMMAGVPIIVNVTGGLQDQCGFRDDDGNLVWVDDHFTYDWGTNHDGKYTVHGEWVKPVYPATRSLVGSPPTPYIFDDRCKWEDVAEAMYGWYETSPEDRKKAGLAGREYCIKNYPDGGGLNIENMAQGIMDGVEDTLKNWTPRSKFDIHKI